jgi:AraC family transcriptional regulator of adaptative response / DNA-3-methyladenine glycosylase II
MSTQHIELPHRDPLDWDGLMRFLAARATAGVELVERGAYLRTVSRCAAIEARRTGGGTVVLRVLGDLAEDELADVEVRMRALLALDHDPAGPATALAADPLIGPLLGRHPGLRVPGAFDGFELAVRAVLGQQVSVAGASTLAARLAREHGEPLATPIGRLERLFPEPERLADAPLEWMPAQRAGAIRALAAASLDGSLDLTRLGELPGIGPWTAEYVALRALADHDAFPHGDLALRRAAGATGTELIDMAERWRPWRGYATLALWRSLEETA